MAGSATAGGATAGAATVQISIIVPCYNSAPFITRTLTALFAEISQHDDVELLLVDNNSTDNTAEMLQNAAAEFNESQPRPVVRVFTANHGQGVNVARNVGASHALGSTLLFTDHDDQVCSGWLSAYRQAFSTGAQIAAGPYTEYAGDGQLIREMNTPELHYWDIPYGLGSNSGITAAGFAQITGFDESWQGGGDDADFFWRAHLAGLNLVFVPDARIVHYMRDDERATIRQFADYGRSGVRLYRKFRRFGMPRSSTLRAIAAWPLALGEFAASYLLPRVVNRRRAASRLGVRWGRLTESIRQRTRYL